MQKYGNEHFKIELIEECDCEILSDREQYWISYYKTYSNGYNATLGGEGLPLYDSDKIVQMYNEGMLVAEIVKELGCDRAVVAKHLKKMGIDTLKNYNGRRDQIYPSVIMCSKETNEILHIFTSCMDAARWLIDNEYSHGSVLHTECAVNRVVNGKRKSAYGFIWRINPNWQGTGLENQE